MTPPRALVLWIPDWPIFAAFGPLDAAGPSTVTHDGVVIACSAAARAQGVRRGQRRRLAQSLSPDLRFLPTDPRRDERAFLPVLRALEEQVPGVALLRPGLAALRVRGASRFYGGEEEAARVLLGVLTTHGHPEARAGVADGLFTAEQAARHADPCLVVAPGDSAAFLAPLPVRQLGDDQIASLLGRLGVHTMAQFARLPEEDVRCRLGNHGVRLQALAAGADSQPVIPRPPDTQLGREVVFETALDQADQVGFAVRQTAEAVIAGLAAASVVCTEVRIDLTDDRGQISTRTWLHPTCFDAADLVDRVRWQLEATAPGVTDDNRVFAGITEVRITPTTTDDAAHHQPGLFGQGRQERLHHGVSRVQALLGHRAVATGSIAGGRLLSDRQQLTPWGDRMLPDRDPQQPWPGRLPHPLPTEVFDPPRAVRVEAADRSEIRVDDRGLLSAPPARIDDSPVTGWAGPWGVRDRTWDAHSGHRAHRLQLVDAQQRAWVVLGEDGRWWAEGISR